jgi:type 1 glutamine amidotransferase
LKTDPKVLLLVFSFLLVGAYISGQAFAAADPSGPKRLRALIVDGQNNHDFWPKTTVMMKTYLEQTGLFTVDVARTAFTWQGAPYDEDGGATRDRRSKYLQFFSISGVAGTKAMDQPVPDPNYRPDFAAYDVVISNFGWHAAAWPRETQLALEKYVQGGGGFVVVHAANNSFPDWVEYNKMTGIGGWGERTEAAGPYLYIDGEGRVVRDPAPGPAGSHGHEQEFLITIRNHQHPVTRGMPDQWMHARDELYDRLRGPAEGVTILGTAYSDLEKNASFWTPLKGTARHEPMVLCREYGKGRVFHTTLGHGDFSMECVGFIVLLQRGAEWAATGDVTQALPADFPTAAKSSIRKWQP